MWSGFVVNYVSSKFCSKKLISILSCKSVIFNFNDYFTGFKVTNLTEFNIIGNFPINNRSRLTWKTTNKNDKKTSPAQNDEVEISTGESEHLSSVLRVINESQNANEYFMCI